MSPRPPFRLAAAALVATLAPVAALALPPDATPGLFSIGTGTVERLAVSTDGSVVVGREVDTGVGFAFFVEDWSVHTLSLCEITTGAAVIPYEDGTWDIWTSCSDGTLRVRNFDGSTMETVVDADGAEVVLQLDTTLSGVWYHPESFALYAFSIADDAPELHVVDPLTLDVDDALFAGYPLSVEPYKNFNEGVIVGDRLVIHHADDNMSSVLLGSSPAVTVSTAPTLAIDVVDIAPSFAGNVYALDDSGFIAEYLPLTMTYQLLLSGLSGPEAVVASVDPEDPWLVVTGQQIKVWEMSEAGAILGNNDEYYWASAPNLDNPIQDAVVSDGYLFGGGLGGNLHVSTSRPWVYPAKISVSPTAATGGDTVTLSFTVKEPGTWEVRRGGDRTGTGTLLAEGEATSVDEEISLELSVDDSWDEGDNALYVLLTNDALDTGHARTSLFVDNPPDPPLLTAANLQFADGALTLAFEGIPDEDLDRYEVYVTTTEFAAADWETGGPEWDGSTQLQTPISVTKAGGEAVTLRIAPLENNVKHYVAVRAWDQGGLEGPMSRVISETPRPTFTAAELAGESGGTPCSTSPVAVGWLALALGAAGGLRRRRARRAIGVLALAAAGLSASPAALAQDDEKEDHGDLTPVKGDFEIRYGVIDLDDEAIDEVYDENPDNILQLEFGPQLWRVFEIDLGLGFFQELAFKVDASGAASSERTMLTWWPLYLDGTFRLQLVDEQIVVPHARFGLDYTIYSEKFDDGTGGKDAIRGAKTGNHWGVGAGLLLDVFARRRASLLEAQTGINDTYVIVEFRRQFVDGREFPWSAPVKDGFDFSGDMITAGIKLDY